MKAKRRKYILAAIIGLCLVFIAGTFVWGMGRQKEAVPENPLEEPCGTFSQVLYTGKGYSADISGDTKDKDSRPSIEEQIPEEETEREETEEEQITENPGGDPSPGEGESAPHENPDREEGEDVGSPLKLTPTPVPTPVPTPAPTAIPPEEQNPPEHADQGNDEENQEGAITPPADDPNEGKYPTIEVTGLEDNVQTSVLPFYVSGYDWQGRYLNSKYLNVFCNGEVLHSLDDDGSRVSYRAELQDGYNEIKITVTDDENRSSEYTYGVTKDGDGEPEIAGSLLLSVEANTIGIGYLFGPQEVEFYQNETLFTLLSRVMEENGYRILTGDSPGYVTGIAGVGITDGYQIPQDLRDKLVEEGMITDDPYDDSYQPDSLSEFDFTGSSGWLYQVNGVYMNTGMDTQLLMKGSGYDGSEVRVRYTLAAGYDVGAKGENSWFDK